MYKEFVKTTRFIGFCAGCWLVAMSTVAVASGPAQPDSTASPLREGPVAVDPRDQQIGRLIEDVRATTLDGTAFQLSSLRGRPVVLFMTSADCPVSRKYLPVVAAMERHYLPRGVAFIAVTRKAGATRETLTACGFAGQCVVDSDGTVARALGASSSTDAFVLDAARTLVYCGAVDDQFGLGYALPAPRRQYLRDAIEAVLAGARAPVEATTAPGCVLDAPNEALGAAAPPRVTYHNRVSRIVQRNCIECHRAGENGPFPLTSYGEVKDNLPTIRRVVQRGVMPPWFADPKVGHWANDRTLSPADRDDLLEWIAAGAPEGDPQDAPVGRKFASGWKIGEPDAVFEAPRAFSIPATGAMDYQRVVVQTDLPQDKWVTAIEIRPSSPAVVHHVLVFLVFPSDHPRAGEQPRYRNGLDGYFAGLVPGQGHVVYPRGVAKFLPRDAMLMFQIHYTPNGAATEDRPKIGIKFSDGPPEHEILTRGVFNTKFHIPPGESNHEVTATHRFAFPVRLLSFNPHSHVRGKAYRYEVIYPDGKAETVLDVPRYDFNWQLEYYLREPLDLPAGARLKVTAWYDNSEKNPANPDPAATVRFGDQTWDEMMIGYFSGYRLK